MTGNRPGAALIFAWLMISLPAVAGQVTFTFVPHDQTAVPGEATLLLRKLERISDVDAGNPTRVEHASVTLPATLDLPDGAWSLDVRAEQWWHARQFFSVRRTREVSIDLWPAGVLVGRLKMTDGSVMPRALTCRFAPSEGGISVPSGEVSCPVDEGAFRCAIAAGKLDLRLRCEGCIAQYLWKTTIEQRPTEIGTLRLARGASLAGRVQFGRGAKGDFKRVRVTASPANLQGFERAVEEARKLAVLSTGVSATNGVFHFDGLAPGGYVLSATTPDGLSSLKTEVTVLQNAFAELRDPLHLDAPQRMAISIAPPADPSGARWHITVDRAAAAHEMDTVADTYATPSGEWSSSPLHAGTYIIRVGPTAGGTWKSETVALTDHSFKATWSIGMRDVHGKVTLGGTPLASRLTFHADEGRTRTVLTSPPEGEFTGSVPDTSADDWTVVVESREPRMKRALHVDAGDFAHLKLDIPLTLMTGTVVDSTGHPVAAAGVNVWAASRADVGLVQTQTADDGTFLVAALPPGKYSAHAEVFLKESKAVEVTIGDESPIPLRLMLEDEQKVPGRVVSEFGPVAGADVLLIPTDVPAEGVHVNHTDISGEFSGTVAPGAREIDVIVAPPGFAFRMVHTRLYTGMMLNLKVEQRLGTIVLPLRSGATRAFLSHAGALVSAESIPFNWPSATIQRLSGVEARLVLAAAEPGPYLLCYLKNEEAAAFRAGVIDRETHCSEGFLAPFGTLELELPSTAPAKK